MDLILYVNPFTNISDKPALFEIQIPDCFYPKGSVAVSVEYNIKKLHLFFQIPEHSTDLYIYDSA